MKTNYLCISCPLGCHLEVTDNEQREVLEVTGQSCKRGEKFAKQEHVDPRRMLTTTVSISDGIWPKLPVKTRDSIPKDKVIPVCHEIHKISIKAPINMGDVILENALGTGVDVIASRSMEKI